MYVVRPLGLMIVLSCVPVLGATAQVSDTAGGIRPVIYGAGQGYDLSAPRYPWRSRQAYFGDRGSSSGYWRRRDVRSSWRSPGFQAYQGGYTSYRPYGPAWQTAWDKYRSPRSPGWGWGWGWREDRSFRTWPAYGEGYRWRTNWPPRY